MRGPSSRPAYARSAADGDAAAHGAGGYWSLEKRQDDLPRMEDEWRRWQAAVPPVGGSVEVATGVLELAAGLHAAAAGLASRLSSLGAASGRTLLHGDFKTANLFFRPAADGGGAAAACPCDFQWAGTGVCMQDVMYLLWTSVEPGVVAAEEEELLAFYREQLRRELAAAGVKRAPTDCELRDQYEVRRRPPSRSACWRAAPQCAHAHCSAFASCACSSEAPAVGCRWRSWTMCASWSARCGGRARRRPSLTRQGTSTRACTSAAARTRCAWCCALWSFCAGTARRCRSCRRDVAACCACSAGTCGGQHSLAQGDAAARSPLHLRRWA